MSPTCEAVENSENNFYQDSYQMFELEVNEQSTTSDQQQNFMLHMLISVFYNL